MNLVLLVVTGLSLLVAGFMSAIAWRMSRDERRRSDVRVAELSSAIYGDGEHPPATARLFDQRATASAFRSVAAAATGACVVAVIAGLGVTAARSPHRTTAAPHARVPDAPLELLALEHERVAAELIVRGIVRNPPEAADRLSLSAVVMLLGHDGGLLSSGRARVQAMTLAPGGTTPFVVTVPETADVDRFRLSFRTDARVEPHVDRRTHVGLEKDQTP
jgi:hypothetical protein